MVRIEPVHGSLMVWFARRTLLAVNRLVDHRPTRIHRHPPVRAVRRTLGETLSVAPRPCDCLSLSSDRPHPIPESPPLELDWPGDHLPPLEHVVVKTRIRYETKLITGVLDLFI